MTERKLCGNCDYQKSVGVSIACQRCYNKSLWKERSKTMTEELEKEAREKYHNHKTIDFQGFYNHHYYYLGYVESAEPREKRIEELEAQIEKMKGLLEMWYNQHSDKTYTETFYERLIKATEGFLWTDIRR